MSLQEFANNNSEYYDIIVKTINLYKDNVVYLLGNTCAVCGKELTKDEIILMHLVLIIVVKNILNTESILIYNL